MVHYRTSRDEFLMGHYPTKVVPSMDEAVADIPNGATIMFGGFGAPGTPRNLIAALLRRGVKDLTVISNRGGGGRGIARDSMDVGRLIEARRVRRVICTITSPVIPSNESPFERMYQAGEIEAELLPQGTFAERIRAGGAGLGGFYTPTGVGTEIAEGREVRRINGREYILELPLRADFSLLRAWCADRYGNLQYRLSQRNFNPLMAMAADVAIAEVEEQIREPGSIEPDQVHTPGVFIDRLIKIPAPPDGIWESPNA